MSGTYIFSFIFELKADCWWGVSELSGMMKKCVDENLKWAPEKEAFMFISKICEPTRWLENESHQSLVIWNHEIRTLAS